MAPRERGGPVLARSHIMNTRGNQDLTLSDYETPRRHEEIAHNTTLKSLGQQFPTADFGNHVRPTFFPVRRLPDRSPISEMMIK
jgi:hypothetical protein